MENEQANKEYEHLLNWQTEKSAEIMERLNEEGIIESDLSWNDDDIQELRVLKEEFNNRFTALKEKYSM